MAMIRVEAVRKSDGHRVQQRITRVMPQPSSNAPPRKVVPANPHASGLPQNLPGVSQPIRVMTYNILCKTYADFKQYPYTPQYSLEWEYRKRLLIEEMTQQYLSDIICLQECEKIDFEQTFVPALGEIGFTGDFQKRPGVKQDGCAIFFNSQKYVSIHDPSAFVHVRKISSWLVPHRFKLHESHCINFDVLEEDPLIKPVKRTYTFRTNNIASLILLERLPYNNDVIDPSQRFVWVICAHLFWNPSVPTVKLLQAKFLLDETRRIQAAFQKRQLVQSAPPGFYDAPARKHNNIGVSDISSPLLAQTRYTSTFFLLYHVLHPETYRGLFTGPGMPVIFCGDLNSTPDSAVYSIIKNGVVQKADLAARKFPLIDWQQPFRTLKSSYEGTGEPVSNITENFTGCLDYIWYDSSNMIVTKVLQNPTQDPVCASNIKEYGFLPSPTHPSDHIPLMAEICFIPPNKF